MSGFDIEVVMTGLGVVAVREEEGGEVSAVGFHPIDDDAHQGLLTLAVEDLALVDLGAHGETGKDLTEVIRGVQLGTSPRGRVLLRVPLDDLKVMIDARNRESWEIEDEVKDWLPDLGRCLGIKHPKIPGAHGGYPYRPGIELVGGGKLTARGRLPLPPWAGGKGFETWKFFDATDEEQTEQQLADRACWLKKDVETLAISLSDPRAGASSESYRFRLDTEHQDQRLRRKPRVQIVLSNLPRAMLGDRWDPPAHFGHFQVTSKTEEVVNRVERSTRPRRDEGTRSRTPRVSCPPVVLRYR